MYPKFKSDTNVAPLGLYPWSESHHFYTHIARWGSRDTAVKTKKIMRTIKQHNRNCTIRNYERRIHMFI